MSATDLSATTQLSHELSDPVQVSEAAKKLGVSTGSIYDSMRRFDAARIAGDVEAMRRHVPCIHRGGVEQKNGTFKGGRYIIPRSAFIRWYTSAGLDGALLDELYGDDAA
jgi:hypothetical protein